LESTGMHRVWISLLVATVLGAPLRAYAEEQKDYPECTHQASEADLTAAKAAFQAGNVSFNEADYPRAILYWEDAFRRDCTANALLLNLARAYELNAQKRKAVVALETYLKREQSSEETAQITRRIEVLKKQIDDEARAQAKAAPTPPTPESPTTAPGSAPATQTAPPPAAEGARPIVPLVVAGVGGVMTIVGAGLYLKAASDVDEYASHCEDPETRSKCPDDEVDEANSARSRQILGGVVAGVGIPVLAGGLIWYFLSPPTTTAGNGTPPKLARVTPTLGAGFMGVAVDGRF
jgi:tetratricopeptide (TPR) repeat protein